MTKHEPTFSVTPGKLLSAAREARGFTMEDIAKRTRLSVQAIHDIEQDEYAQIGVRTFVRGYLCTYARLVGVSEKQVLEAFDASGLMPSDTRSLLPRIEGAPVTNVTHHQRTRTLSKQWMAVGAGVLTLILVISLWHSPKESSVKNMSEKTNTTSLAFVETPAAPAAATTAPEATTTPPVASTPEVKKTKKVAHKKKENENNGFVIRPTAMHTTYKVSPAT